MNGNKSKINCIKGRNVCIGKNVIINGNIILGDNTFIENGVYLGYPYSGEIKEFMKRDRRKITLNDLITKQTIIGEGCIIRHGSRISAGAQVGDRVYCDFDCFIGTDTKIGDNVNISYRAQIYDGVIVGDNSWIAGFISDRCRVGRNVVIMGNLIHKYDFPPERMPVLDEIEESPIIEDSAFVGFNAIVIGGIKVGEGAYVAAGAVVTKDVPSYSVVVGNPARILKKIKS